MDPHVNWIEKESAPATPPNFTRNCEAVSPDMDHGFNISPGKTDCKWKSFENDPPIEPAMARSRQN